MALLNHRSGRSGQRGSLSVEMALFFPLMIMLFIGGIELSLLAYNQQILSSAVRDGARAAAMYRSGTTTAQVFSDINTRWGGMLISLGRDPGQNPIVNTGSSDCTAGAAEAQVSGSFLYSFITPFTEGALGPVTLTARSRMRCE